MSFLDEIQDDEQTIIGAAVSSTKPLPTATIAVPVEDPLTEEEAAALAEAATIARNNAFINSDIHSWMGRPLFPFSSGREALWIELRNAVGAPPLRSVFTGDVQNQFPDMARIIWTCYFPGYDGQRRKRLDDQFPTLVDWRRTARGDMFALDGQIMAWMDEHISGLQERVDISELGLKIWREAQVNRAESSPTPGKTGSGLGE